MKTNDHPVFRARTDRRLLTDRGGVRHILVDVTAPEITRPDDAERPPLDLALVIDASGSMSGPSIEAARLAATGVVAAMGPRDRITVISFADDVQTHVASLPVADQGRATATRAIAKLTTRGCTDLCGGWQAGVTTLTDHARNGAQRRVVVLSDGHANQGVVDPEQLGLEAAAALAKGVATTCVGIGEHYSTTQLAALCEHGGGNLHHAARPEEIVEVVCGELGQILTTVVEGVALELSVPSGVSAESVGPFPTRERSDGAVVELGSLTSGASRRVVVRLRCPEGVSGDRLSVLITPTWRRPGADEVVRAETLAIELLYAPVEEVATECPDIQVCLEIAEAWQRNMIRRASLMVEEGDREGAAGFVDEMRRELEDYLRDLPGGEEILERLQWFRMRLDRSMSAGLAKEVSSCMYKLSRCTPELRERSSFRMEDIDRMD